MRLFPSSCPSCGHVLRGKRFDCGECGTAVEGDFSFPTLLRLSPDDQEFVLYFVRSSGSLKALAKRYAVSYPTVRNRMDALIARLDELETSSGEEDA